MEQEQPGRVGRRLAAIVAADVAGYSRLMGLDEVGTARTLREHRKVTDALVAKHGGRLVKSTGDGVLLEFPSVVDAVECAVAVQAVMAQRNEGVPQDRRMLFRIGINLGDILIEGDDILGDGVNVAARLEGIAEPGGICISSSAYDQVRGKVAVEFTDLGEQTLKNIARPIRAYAVGVNANADWAVPLSWHDAFSIAISRLETFELATHERCDLQKSHPVTTIVRLCSTLASWRLVQSRGDVMRRREFITLISGAMAWPIAAVAQQRGRIPRVGVLWHAANAKEEQEYLGALTKAFRDLGYVEGKNIELDHRFPAEQPERFRILAQELVDSKVDMIIAVTGLGAKAAKQATGTIPIVLVADPDPVGNGLVESLAHPGGNVTGLSLMASDLSGKRLALLKEVIPKLARIAVVLDPRDPFSKASGVAYERAAKGLGFSVKIFEVRTADDIEQAFSAIARDGFDGACVVGPPMYNERARVGRIGSGAQGTDHRRDR